MVICRAGPTWYYKNDGQNKLKIMKHISNFWNREPSGSRAPSGLEVTYAQLGHIGNINSIINIETGKNHFKPIAESFCPSIIFVMYKDEFYILGPPMTYR